MSAGSKGGVLGGVGWPCWFMDDAVTWPSQRMTFDACIARWVIISRDTGSMTNSFNASRLYDCILELKLEFMLGSMVARDGSGLGLASQTRIEVEKRDGRGI